MMEKDRNLNKVSTEPTSVGTSESTDVPRPRILRPTWSVTGVKGKMSDKCLWSACKAMTAGILLIAVGAGMATLGFYADQLSTVEETKGNTTVWVKNESKDTHLGSLTYLGPIVMGVGGFTIVAACVMTFEARDTAAKIVPIWFRRTRIHVVSGGSGSTPSGRSSKTSWEKILSQQKSSEEAADTRSAITEALINFSKYLQNNVDPTKLPTQGPPNEHNVGLHKCPSEPNLPKLLRQKSDSEMPEATALLEASTPQPTQRASYGGGLKPFTVSTRPQLLSVAPDTYRQAVSMDCPRPVRLHRQEAHDSNQADTTPSIPLLIANKGAIQTLILQTSCTTSSSGSMSVDIYLPQGNVTLRVHDDMKETSKKPPVNLENECATTKFMHHSDIHTYPDDDELFPPLEEDLFMYQDATMTTPKITFDTPDKDADPIIGDFCIDNLIPLGSELEQLAIEEWIAYQNSSMSETSPSRDASIDSLEMNFSHDSPRSMSSTTPYSFDYSDLDSPGLSITSVLSTQQSSKFTEQNSFSQTENSFMNVSSLNSMGSSQDVFSPLAFPGSPRDPRDQQFFPRNDSITSESNFSRELVRTLSKPREPPTSSVNKPNESTDNTPQFDHLLKFQHVSCDMGEVAAATSGINISPKRFSSLGSSEEMLKGSLYGDINQERKHHSLGSSENVESDVPNSAKFLSPHQISGAGCQHPTGRSMSHSPRKTRSDSLPERRTHAKSASLKRFPLLRQVALDAFAEESGSTQKLDRGSRIYIPISSPRHKNTSS